MKLSPLCASALALVGALQAASPAVTKQCKSPSGREFFSLPDEKGAVDAARKNLAADPRNVGLMLKLAAAQSSVWQYREAVETCTRVLTIAPGNADAYLERGHRELGLREFDKAQADLAQAVKLDPKKVDAYYHLGLAHYFLQQFPGAAEAFGHAVELAPDTDNRINSSNWWYASLRRAKMTEEARKALATITPDVTTANLHTKHYLALVRFFQRAMPESQALPPEPPAGNTDTEAELTFDTVGYGIGNWYLYNNQPAKAQTYFTRVEKGHVWVTWGFIGSELELGRAKTGLH